MTKDNSVLPDLLELLPHRYPFLLLDRITSIEPGQRASGIKYVTGNEWFFGEAFPARHPSHARRGVGARKANCAGRAHDRSSRRAVGHAAFRRVTRRHPFCGDQLVLRGTAKNVDWPTGA